MAEDFSVKKVRKAQGEGKGIYLTAGSYPQLTEGGREGERRGLAHTMSGFLVEANWWLYLVLFASIFILLAINVYIVVIWQHPDDKNEAYFPKAVVVSLVF